MEQEKHKNAKDLNDMEDIVSPGKQILLSFAERKSALGALFVVLAMFAFAFIGPFFLKNYSDSYTEVTQKSIPPTMTMMSVPKEMAKDIKAIDSSGSFTVGLSGKGKLYVWGATKIGTTGIDMKDIPEEVKNAKIAMAAAGTDHIVAIGEDGRIYAWGSQKLGQFGRTQAMLDNPNIQVMPEELFTEGVDASKVKKLAAGYQCTAILMEDGTLYVWGNRLTYANMDKFLGKKDLKDVDFLLNYMVGVPKSGKTIYTGTRGLFGTLRENVNAKAVKLKTVLGDRTIDRIAAGNNSLAVILDDGKVYMSGDFSRASKPLEGLSEGERFLPDTISAGTYHFSGITNKGKVYSWGGDHFGEAAAPKDLSGISKVYSCSFQNYGVDENGKLLAVWGLRGYLFGTDRYGADIFQRICAGGKMTMTIGAVAVIISTVIGIGVGCVSGYFGGKVDLFLMRVMEIFSAIPFLPFALILTSVMSQMTLSEDMRIFIIMVILGILSWPPLARLVRGQVLVARESEYVMAAKAMGVREGAIAFKHILPNIISVILVTLTLDFAGCMLTESSLSYLGFGVQYPRPTWGNMLNGANNATVIGNFWWQWVFTSLFLAVTTICINIVGDTLRDVMDPKSASDR